MPRVRADLIALLRKDLLKDFTSLSNVSERGVAKYTHEYIMSVLERKYYRDAQTLMLYIRKELALQDEIKKKESSQGTLFDENHDN